MKYLKFIIPIVLIFCISLFFLLRNEEKFYLSDNYYGSGEYIDIDTKGLEKLINNKESFLLYTYNNFCSLPIPCDKIFESTMKKYGINILQIKFSLFKETDLYKKVKLAPSVMIFKSGKLKDYLDAESDEDLKLYQDSKEFEKWLSKYIEFKK